MTNITKCALAKFRHVPKFSKSCLVKIMGVLKYLDKSYLLYATANSVNKFKCTTVKLKTTVSKHGLSDIEFLIHDKPVLEKNFLRIWITFLAAFIQLAQLIALQYKAPGDVKRHLSYELILGWFNWAAITGITSMIHVSRDKGPELKVYLNSLSKFTKRHKPRIPLRNETEFSSKSLLEWLHLLLVPLLIVSAVVIPPLLVLGLHLINPCKPSLIGYFVLVECHKTKNIPTKIVHTVLNFIVKIVVFLGNIWILWFAFHGAIALVILVTILGSMTSKECLQIFLIKIKSGKEIFKDAVLYRELCIINILCNCVQQKYVEILMGMAICLLSISLNLMVMFINQSSQEQTNGLIVVLFALVVAECVFVLLVIFEGMVGVYKESKYKLRICKRMMNTYESVKCRRWIRRYWGSCNVLKIKFGEVNFFEELTPLRCLDLAFNLTVQLILLSRSR